MSSSECGSSSDEEPAPGAPMRKFEISKMIEVELGSAPSSFLRQWTFVMDDGVMERQAIFSNKADLWRHLDRIDGLMSKLSKKAKKGTVRLFWAETSQAWAKVSSEASKFVFRFSRKFPVDLADFWVKLVLSMLGGHLPHADRVLGCVYTTRKGKSEMEVFLADDPHTQHEDDLAMRSCLDVDPDESTIQIAFKSRAELARKQADLARVQHVKQKQKGNTWPLLKGSDDPEEDLVALKQELRRDAPCAGPQFQYTFEQTDDSVSLRRPSDTEDRSVCSRAEPDSDKRKSKKPQETEDRPVSKGRSKKQSDDTETPPRADTESKRRSKSKQGEDELVHFHRHPRLSHSRGSPTPSQTPHDDSAHDNLKTQANSQQTAEDKSDPSQSPLPDPSPTLPALSLEQLQELQLEQLRIASASDSDSEKTAKEDVHFSPLKPSECPSPTPLVAMSSPMSFHVPPCSPDDSDPEFERRLLYGSPEDHSLVETPKRAPPPEKTVSPPLFVLGTNPPDLSSPVMKATLTGKNLFGKQRRAQRALSL